MASGLSSRDFISLLRGSGALECRLNDDPRRSGARLPKLTVLQVGDDRQKRLAPHKVWQGEPFPRPNSAPTTARVLGCALRSSRVFVIVPTELSFLTVQPCRARV